MNTIAFSCLEVTTIPVITAQAYSSGKQLGGIQTLTSACQGQNRLSQLLNVTVLDADNQSSAINVLLFNQSPTIASADTATFSATAANLKLQLVGSFQILSTDYFTAGTVSVASVAMGNAFFKSLDNAGALYAVAISAGTPTYASTSSIQFRWAFASHF